MSDFEAVPIIDVHKENFIHLWPAILLAVKKASFIAIDTELSGIGNRRLINARCMDDRYKAVCFAAKSRSIISFGISCFKLRQEEEAENKGWNYLVQTFNLTALCSDEYVVEPDALQFLVGHGFDFNKQYKLGIPYYKGNDRKNQPQDQPCLRQLFVEIIRSGKSVVLHNALIDLVFMHQCWYAELPSKLPTFLKDLHKIYSGGIYDTKYIAEYKARTPASYLEYIFRRLQRENDNSTCLSRKVEIQFLHHRQLNCIEYKNLGIDTTGEKTVSSSEVCMTYANHGWCPNGHSCPLSHNVDCVLDMEIGIKGKKRKRKAKRRRDSKKMKVESENTVKDEEEEEESIVEDRGDLVIDLSPEVSRDNARDKNEEKKENEVNEKENGSSKGETESEFEKLENGNTVDKSQPEEPNQNGHRQQTEVEVIHKDKQNGSFEEPEVIEQETSNVKKEEELEEGEIQSSPTKCFKPKCENDIMKTRLNQKSSGHRAGCDAFMTGVVMAVFLSRFAKKREASLNDLECIRINDAVNKIYLSGKDVPMIVQESEFAKHSKSFLEKHERLQN